MGSYSFVCSWRASCSLQVMFQCRETDVDRVRGALLLGMVLSSKVGHPKTSPSATNICNRGEPSPNLAC